MFIHSLYHPHIHFSIPFFALLHFIIIHIMSVHHALYHLQIHFFIPFFPISPSTSCLSTHSCPLIHFSILFFHFSICCHHRTTPDSPPAPLLQKQLHLHSLHFLAAPSLASTSPAFKFCKLVFLVAIFHLRATQL